LTSRGLHQIWGSKLFRATLLAGIGLLDNLTTLLALRAGAHEVNILVKPFTGDTVLFTIFSIFKAAVLFIVAYKAIDYNKTRDRILYYILLALFTQATIVNTLNALK
jgi:hypothetical protein